MFPLFAAAVSGKLPHCKTLPSVLSAARREILYIHMQVLELEGKQVKGASTELVCADILKVCPFKQYDV